jgi:hypothetical protein
MTLATGGFIRRFPIHVLPHGFHRIRHYGLLASGARAQNIARTRQLLQPRPQPSHRDPDALADLPVLRRAHDDHRDLQAWQCEAVP